MLWATRIALFLCAVAALPLSAVHAQATAARVAVDASPAGRRQVIDGFGTALNERASEPWVQRLFLDELQGSIARWDVTPRFLAPYSDSFYTSPWFGSAIALPGPDGNNVRTYSSPSDYGREFGGLRAPIAVMGPDIEANIAKFDFRDPRPASAGAFAQVALARKTELGDFKVIGSIFSPAPWLKVASGHFYEGGTGVFPTEHTPWPFIWAGNFGGGYLDVSGVPLEVFHDGTGPTSALTQFARTTAAYLRGFQRTFGVSLYAISVQNEPNFEDFFDTCSYPLAARYGAALKVLRAELNKYPDLASIRLIGPEDLLIDTPYALWQFGGGETTTHKGLRYLHELRATDPAALAALDFVALHATVSEQTWRWWAEGWTSSPGGGLPAQLDGFTAYGRKSWMTETSGGESVWPAPESGNPEQGALQMALGIHRALTVGRQSAWLHWQLVDADNPAGPMTLTDATLGARAPKLVAAKHFFRMIRPNAQRVEASVEGASGLHVSAYVHDRERTVTVVLINTAAAAQTADVALAGLNEVTTWTSYTSSASQSFAGGRPEGSASGARVTVPAYGIVTLQGKTRRVRPPPRDWWAMVAPPP